MIYWSSILENNGASAEDYMRPVNPTAFIPEWAEDEAVGRSPAHNLSLLVL